MILKIIICLRRERGYLVSRWQFVRVHAAALTNDLLVDYICVVTNVACVCVCLFRAGWWSVDDDAARGDVRMCDV